MGLIQSIQSHISPDVAISVLAVAGAIALGYGLRRRQGHKVFCWICGTDPDRTFHVQITKSADVHDLKKAIKKEKSKRFESFDADELTLWKFPSSISIDQVSTKVGRWGVQSLHDIGAEKLSPTRRLRNVFPNQSGSNEVQIIVQVPLASISPSSGDGGLSSSGLTPRPVTVTALYEKIRRYRFVHVRGTPGSGKSATAELLYHHIRQVAPGAPVYVISSWAPDEVKPLGWRDYLSHFVLLDGSAYLIFDEGQMTYWDATLWNDLFKSPLSYVAGVIVLASYGSPASSLSGLTPPLEFRREQLVSLYFGEDIDGTGIAGLLFTRPEFDSHIIKQHPTHCFTPDFLTEVYERTDGHIGAIERLLDLVRNMTTYRQCLQTHSPFSWSDFNKINPYQLLTDLGSPSAFSRGLPSRETLQDHSIAEAFHLILCAGWHTDLPLKVLEERNSHPGFVTCVKRGWIQSEHIWDEREKKFMDNRMLYHFASPLHMWCIQMYYGSLPSPPILETSLLQFCIDIIGHFSCRNIAAPRQINAMVVQPPPEAQYQDEFYHCCQAVAPGNIIFSEFGARKGHIDFYLPFKKWGVELLRDGNDLQGHACRFSSHGWYAGVFPTDDHVILDFCHTSPRKAHPHIENLYHVVFAADFTSVQLLDNQLQVVSGSNIHLLDV